MKKLSKFNAGMALGSFTAAVALLAGMPVASAQMTADASDTSVSGQAAPGGGSFPGSFLVPGTNTSIKIGGFAKGVYIYDMSAANGQSEGNVVVPGTIPLNGSATGQLHGATRLHAKQSNFAFDVRTPTAWGELDTFILTDFFGSQAATSYQNSNTQNARLVLAYGSLGPVLAGQGLSLWFDGQALGESVDPTTSVGIMNGLTNRQPQFRYTFVAGGGISLAASMEQPVWEVLDNAAGVLQGQNGSVINRYPDFIAKGQIDQAWGHAALAGILRDQKVIAAGVPRVSKVGWGINLSGHVNTFGKDTLRGGFMVGEALGHYLSDMFILGGGLQTNLATTTVKTPVSYGGNISYTHWWTNELRSTAMFGYSHVEVTSAIASNAAQNALDKMHLGGTINLVWSPVPQVDFGIEYDHVHRVTAAPLTGAGGAIAVTSSGMLNRIEAEGVFKF